jgi:hypothetical protein
MFRFCLAVLLVVPAVVGRAELTVQNATQVTVAPMKTSIYVGSVSLTTGVFERADAKLTATYEVKVFPWIFWGETGRISITLSDAARASIAKGETAEFTGEAINHKNKPRTVTGRAQPIDATSGKIKVRIGADGYVLIFNSTYRFGPR